VKAIVARDFPAPASSFETLGLIRSMPTTEREARDPIDEDHTFPFAELRAEYPESILFFD